MAEKVAKNGKEASRNGRGKNKKGKKPAQPQASPGFTEDAIKAMCTVLAVLPENAPVIAPVDYPFTAKACIASLPFTAVQAYIIQTGVDAYNSFMARIRHTVDVQQFLSDRDFKAPKLPADELAVLSKLVPAVAKMLKARHATRDVASIDAIAAAAVHEAAFLHGRSVTALSKLKNGANCSIMAIKGELVSEELVEDVKRCNKLMEKLIKHGKGKDPAFRLRSPTVKQIQAIEGVEEVLNLQDIEFIAQLHSDITTSKQRMVSPCIDTTAAIGAHNLKDVRFTNEESLLIGEDHEVQGKPAPLAAALNQMMRDAEALIKRQGGPGVRPLVVPTNNRCNSISATQARLRLFMSPGSVEGVQSFLALEDARRKARGLAVPQWKLDCVGAPQFRCGVPVVVVSNPNQLMSEAAEIMGNSVLGFDTEWKPTFRPGEKPTQVDLVQLASDRKCWVIQTNFAVTTPAAREILAKCVEGPTLAGVGVSGDQKLLELTVGRSLELKTAELMQLGNRMKLANKGLQSLVWHVCGEEMKKSKKLSMFNWSLRSIPQANLDYAAADAWAGLVLYKAMVSGEV
ncbi:3'-5' exonuclease [Carpediemonas membranifera]|uniref:3'-5' exonuclease n=1 Tax=Carpediemonas membranifera TaxID=201153 RepID=A0A8J6B3T2_9EUKA|nr:3'-5' exonuclease [Carpediemonas membranifera]|eukprot:KAG9392342.1 3'-5' exonuclease [Carpediemonas membranifera]